jgi:hypothetical protein
MPATENSRSAVETWRQPAWTATHAIGAGRVDQVLALTGLENVATKRVGGFSLDPAGQRAYSTTPG